MASGEELKAAYRGALKARSEAFKKMPREKKRALRKKVKKKTKEAKKVYLESGIGDPIRRKYLKLGKWHHPYETDREFQERREEEGLAMLFETPSASDRKKAARKSDWFLRRFKRRKKRADARLGKKRERLAKEAGRIGVGDEIPSERQKGISTEDFWPEKQTNKGGQIKKYSYRRGGLTTLRKPKRG